MSEKQKKTPLVPKMGAEADPTKGQAKPAGEQASPIPGMSLKDYTVNLRKTTEATKQMNLEEIEHCKHNIEQLQREDLDKLELPILVHNFIILAPKYRFEVLDSIETLMRELVKSIGILKAISKERMAAVKVLNDIKEVKRIDKEEEFGQVDISQFLTAYFHFMFIGKHTDNHEQRKQLKHIREYMIEKLQIIQKEKEQTVGRCDDILQHKLAGEE